MFALHMQFKDLGVYLTDENIYQLTTIPYFMSPYLLDIDKILPSFVNSPPNSLATMNACTLHFCNRRYIYNANS